MGCDEVISSGTEEHGTLYIADRLEWNPSFHTVYMGVLCWLPGMYMMTSVVVTLFLRSGSTGSSNTSSGRKYT